MVLTFKRTIPLLSSQGGGVIYITYNTPTEFPLSQGSHSLIFVSLAAGAATSTCQPSNGECDFGRNLLPKIFIVRKGLGSESLDPGMLG